jgi:hypothetical protein
MAIDPAQLQPLGDAGLLLYSADPDRYFIFKPRWDGLYSPTIVAGWPTVSLRTWPPLLSRDTPKGAQYRDHYAETLGSDVPVFPTTGPKGQLGLAESLWWFMPGAQRLGGPDQRPKRVFDSLASALDVIIRFYSHAFGSDSLSEEELAQLLTLV